MIDLENTLDHYAFCQNLNNFIKDINNTQNKLIDFFIDQVQNHKKFIQQNQANYRHKLSTMMPTCSHCKQSMQANYLQKTKSNLLNQFNDPFQLYNKPQFLPSRNNHDKKKVNNRQGESLKKFKQISRNKQSQNNMQQEQDYTSLVQLQMYKILNQSKKIRFTQADDINSIYNRNSGSSQQTPINHVQINEMLYQLQNQLNKRSNKIQQFIDQMNIFQDSLNYHNQKKNDKKQDKNPDTMNNQLNSAFKNLVRKVYKKFMDIKKQKQDSLVSTVCQTDSFIDSMNQIKQLQKQKNKLVMELKQSQNDKIFQVNTLKQQNQTLSSQINKIIKDKVYFQSQKDQYFSQKQSFQKQCQKLVLNVDILKAEIEKNLIQLEKQKKNSYDLKNQIKQLNKKLIQLKQMMKLKNQSLSKVSHVQSNNQNKKKKLQIGAQQQLSKMLQRNQLEILKKLAQNRVLVQKKRFLAPRKSKLSETVQNQDSALVQTVSYLSKFKQENNDSMKNDQEKGQSDSSISEENTQNQNQQKIIQNNKENQINQNQINQEQQQILSKRSKNTKCKTINYLNFGSQYKIKKKYGRSSKSISQNSQKAKKNLQLFKQISKLNNIQKKLKKQIDKSHKSNKKTIHFNPKNEQIYSKNKIQMISMKKIDIKSKQKLSKNMLVIQKTQPQQSLNKSIKNSSKNLNSKVSIKKYFTESSQHVQEQYYQKPSTNVSIRLMSRNKINQNNQIYHTVQQNNGIGIQTQLYEEDILQMLYEQQAKIRRWNSLVLNLDGFKFLYKDFLTQICRIVQKQQNNPIRKANFFKGSESIVKKTHNYQFNKRLVFNSTVKDKNTTNPSFQNHYNSQQKQKTFHPKFLTNKLNNERKSDESLNNNNNNNNDFNLLQINNENDNKSRQTLFTKSSKNYLNIQNNQSQKKPSYHDFTIMNNVANFQISNRFDHQQSSQSLKKSSLTLNKYKQNFIQQSNQFRDNKQNNQISNQIKNQVTNKSIKMTNKIPFPLLPQRVVMTELTQIINQLPGFYPKDVKNLFISIQNARKFEQDLKFMKQKNNTSLERQQIHFSTQLFTVLANLHLSQADIYKKIRNALTNPVKIMQSENIQQINDEKNLMNDTNLKKCLGNLIQIHRKCNKNIITKGSKTPIKKVLCCHLIQFKHKIIQILNFQKNMNTNKIRQQRC